MKTKTVCNRIGRFTAIAFTFLFIANLFFCPTVCAGDEAYRLSHNDQDTLIIGEVVAVENDYFEINPHYYIESVDHMGRRSLVRPARVLIEKDADGYIYGNDHTPVQKGQSVLASLDKTDNPDTFQVAWGIYRLTSTNIRYMGFEAPVDPYIESFVRSGIIYNMKLEPYIATIQNKRLEYPTAIVYPADYSHNKDLATAIFESYFLEICVGIVLVGVSVLVTHWLTKRKYEKKQRGS